MSKDTDSELATNVKAAKTKRMYFAFVAKGSNDGALVISKTKVAPALITDAKKRSGGTQVFKGACFGEEGKLVFEMAQEPPATMETALKTVIHRGAALTQVCVCRIGTNPDLADDTPTTDRPSAVAPTQVATTKPSGTAKPSEMAAASAYSKYTTYLSTVQSRLTQALKDQAPDAEKLKSVFGYARDQAANKHFDKAIQGLAAVETLLDSHDGKYTPTVSTTGTGGGGPSVGGHSPPSVTTATTTAPTESNPYSATLRRRPSFESSAPEVPTVVGGHSPPGVTPATTTASEEALAQAKLKPDRIDSEWARSIDLDKCKVKFSSNPPKGNFAKLGFIESTDPATPPLVIKVPLREDSAAGLQKEVDFYKQVGEHPNFAKCLGIADVSGQRGLVMEKVNGKDMEKTMDKLKEQYASGKISHEEYWGAVQHTLRQTLDAIAYLESVGVVHNDIRMENMMCDEATGQMKVLDFGISVQAGEVAGDIPVRTGTVSPDVYERDERGLRTGNPAPLTAKHDVFSVGAAGFAAGEKQMFDYGTNTGLPTSPEALAALARFGDVDAAGKSHQAIKLADKLNPAFVKDAQGNARHVAGRSGADTAYTKFINRLMDPDPKKRLSPANALKEPFLTESLMDEEAARGVFKKLLAPETPAPSTAPGQTGKGSPIAASPGTPGA